MKIVSFLLFFFLLGKFSFAQVNLVPNPSFEIYSMCPNTVDQLNYSTGWSSYSQSPDYFNICGSLGLAPPNASFGFQFPYSGNSYAGFLAMVPGDTNYREIIGTQLSSSLIIGNTYYFSFFINIAAYLILLHWLRIKLDFDFQQFHIHLQIHVQ